MFSLFQKSTDFHYNICQTTIKAIYYKSPGCQLQVATEQNYSWLIFKKTKTFLQNILLNNSTSNCNNSTSKTNTFKRKIVKLIISSFSYGSYICFCLSPLISKSLISSLPFCLKFTPALILPSPSIYSPKS